jgi:hypothetical protein
MHWKTRKVEMSSEVYHSGKMVHLRNPTLEKEEPMNTKRLFILLVWLISLLVSGCAASTPANPVDRFAGTWSGTMSFTDDANRKEDIIVTIPAGCTLGNVCGDLDNTTVNCKWEMTLGSVNDNVFEYKFSKTLNGECPALGGGTLTMQSDGTLMREHKTPDFTASGVLTRK